jgi:hypothetical protein
MYSLNNVTSGQPADTCYTDEGKKKFCYKNFGNGLYNGGLDWCQGLGGRLPVVLLAGKQTYLQKYDMGPMI